MLNADYKRATSQLTESCAEKEKLAKAYAILAEVSEEKWLEIFYTKAGSKIAPKLLYTRLHKVVPQVGQYLYGFCVYTDNYIYQNIPFTEISEYVVFGGFNQAYFEKIDISGLMGYWKKQAIYYQSSLAEELRKLEDFEHHFAKLKEMLNTIEKYNITAVQGCKIHVNYTY